MPLIFPDEVLRDLKMDERGARIEFACRLFDASRLSLPKARRLSGLDRGQFEEELRSRGIALYRPTPEDIRHDVETLKRLGV